VPGGEGQAQSLGQAVPGGGEVAEAGLDAAEPGQAAGGIGAGMVSRVNGSAAR
jgi:hypothetical protein